MPRYLVTYTDGEGEERSERLESPNARSLVNQLTDDGATGIVVHDSDFQARLKDTQPWTRNLRTVDEELRDEQAPTIRSPAFWRSWGALLAVGGVLLLGISLRGPWSLWTVAGGVVGLLLLYMSLASHVLPVFGAMMRAKSWHRWSEMEAAMRRAAHLSRFLGLKVLKHELAAQEAALLAARGHLDEGCALLERLRSQAGWDEATYCTRVSDLYMVRHDRGGALRWLRRGYEASDADSLAYIDYARTLAEDAQADEAERVLHSREPAALTTPARIFIAWTEALISFARGEHEAAAAGFQNVLDLIAPIYDPGVWEGVRLNICAHMGLSLASIGDPGAKALLDSSNAYVRAACPPSLLRRCEEALAREDLQAGEDRSEK